MRWPAPLLLPTLVGIDRSSFDLDDLILGFMERYGIDCEGRAFQLMTPKVDDPPWRPRSSRRSPSGETSMQNSPS